MLALLLYNVSVLSNPKTKKGGAKRHTNVFARARHIEQFLNILMVSTPDRNEAPLQREEKRMVGERDLLAPPLAVSIGCDAIEGLIGGFTVG